MNKKISESIKVDQAFAPVDIDTDQTSPWFPMANYRRVMGVVNVNTVAITKNVTIQLLQGTNSSGTGSKALSAVVTQNAVAATKMNLSVEAKASDLDDGFTHVAIKVTSDTATALLAAATLIRADGRYGTLMP